MKFLLAACMIFTTTFACAAEPATGEAPQTSPPVSGKVLEVKQVNSYTYLRLKTPNGEKWSAVPKAQVKKGATVTIDNISIMHNFTSKTLNQTFPTILFGNLADKAMSAPNMGAAHPPIGKQVAITDVKVPKAKGANAMTIAEIFKNSASLKNKPVLLSGKVVKYLPEIMGKNWLHLRDGTGSAADNTNDILVTTQSKAKVGDIVTVKGIIHTDINLGSGYSYKVLIEDATLQ